MAVVERIYAKALYDAARGKGRLAEVRAELADFDASVQEVPELRALLRNPQLDPRVKASALEEILGEGDVIFRNFVRLLAEKGRIAALHEVAREFERLIARDERRLEVELTTAFELSDEEAGRIVSQIEQASGRRVDATRKVDPRLIGGVVLQAGSLRVDASVSGRIERLRRELISGSRA